MSIETWLLIALVWLVYWIGYGLSVAGSIVLAKAAGDEVPYTDFVVILLWPVLAPLLLEMLLRKTK